MARQLIWVLAALLAAPATAQDCPDNPAIRTNIEQVRADCLGAAGALVALEAPGNEEDAGKSADALQRCARSARLLGLCKGGQACLFSGAGPGLPQCGASPRRLSAVALEAAKLWSPAPGAEAGARLPDAPQRLQWSGFLFRLYGERCRSLSGCWAWLKSRALSSDPRDYRDQELAARIDQTSRRMEGMRNELSQTLKTIWQGPAPDASASDGLQTLLHGGSQSLQALAADVHAARVAVENHLRPGAPDHRRSTDTSSSAGEDAATGKDPPDKEEALAAAISGLASAVAALKPEKPAQPAPLSQIRPDDDYERIFTQARSIGYGLLLVPDPRVPRHRRSYDMSIASTSQAMLAEDYVLDRYSMPWQDYLDNPASKPAAAAAAARYLDDGRFGVLLYRHDGWRNGSAGYDIRVLFVVAETASFGVQQQAFIGAVARLLEKTACTDGLPRQFALVYPGAAGAATPACTTDRPLSIIGPAFSGSITSLVEALHQVDAAVLERESRCAEKFGSGNAENAAAGITRNPPAAARDEAARRDDARQCAARQRAAQAVRCTLDFPPCGNVYANLISPATTATSNGNLEKLLAETQATRFRIHYQRLAVSDKSKLEELGKLLPPEGPHSQEGADTQPEPPSVVLFAEASIFGNGLCPRDSPLKVCKRSVTIHFPANIADIRYGQNAQDRAHRQQVQDSLKVSQERSTLALEDGAENGSEFPESQRSPLSTVSASAVLDQLIEQARAYRPRLIIVAATDVRDRLFLFDRLRRQIPGALLVDLETDVLMSHPNFIHASRGSLLLGSARLSNRRDQPQEALVSFATDDQALLYAAIRSLCDPQLPLSCQAAQGGARLRLFRDAAAPAPVLHMPTQQGLMPVTLDPPCEGRWPVTVLQWLSPLLALLAVAALALLHQLLRPRRGAKWWRRGAAIAGTITLLGLCLYGLCRIPPLQGNSTLLALSGVNPWLAAAIVAGAVGFAVLYVLGTRSAYALSVALTDGEVRHLLPGGAGSAAQRQNLIAPLDLTNGGIALPAFVAMLLWLWLLITQPGWRHGLLQGWAEMMLTFAQPIIALAAVAGLVLFAAWTHCALISARRVAAMAQRFNGDGLPPWSALPGFLVGSIAAGPRNWLEKTLRTITGGEAELRVVPPLQADAPLTRVRARPRFAATPLLARSRYFDWLDQALSDAAHRSRLERLCQLQNDFSDNLRERALLALIFAYQAEAARYSLYFGLLMALALPLLAYSYPLAGGERYALFGLVLLLAGAFLSAFLLHRMQHAPALDRLLCDGEGKTKFEYQTLTALFSPLLMALFGWAVVKMPGVLDWSGGMLEVLLGVFKR